jgi:hypothetical protein
MKTSLLKVLIAAVLTAQQPASWLDTKKDWKWSEAELHRGHREAFNPMCDPFTPTPTRMTRNERLILDNNWRLSGASNPRNVAGLSIELVTGFRQFDAMCRLAEYQVFVFVNDRPIGTLSPDLMDAREDGALSGATILDSGEISATYARYAPSRTSTVTFSIVSRGNTFVLRLTRVETQGTP